MGMTLEPGSADGARRRYDLLAPGYDRRWSSYVEGTVRETLARIELRDGERILDVGCGTGALLAAVAARVPGARPGGVDLSTAMLEVARRKLPRRVALVAGEAGSLPFPDGCLDLVVSLSALHHWFDPAGALAEIFRVLAPGGRVAVTDWCADGWSIQVMDFLLRILEPGYHRAYRASGLARLLKEAGFGEIRVARYRVGRWGLMTATGLRGRQLDG